jgi:hypothetical protein
MANLMVVEVNTKRKDAEVAGHGFSIFLDPKRAKLQVWNLRFAGHFVLSSYISKKTA